MMAIGNARREAHERACRHHVLAIVVDERQLAGEHINELILRRVPVPKRRDRTWIKDNVVDAKLGDPSALASRA